MLSLFLKNNVLLHNLVSKSLCTFVISFTKYLEVELSFAALDIGCQHAPQLPSSNQPLFHIIWWPLSCILADIKCFQETIFLLSKGFESNPSLLGQLNFPTRPSHENHHIKTKAILSRLKKLTAYCWEPVTLVPGDHTSGCHRHVQSLAGQPGRWACLLMSPRCCSPGHSLWTKTHWRQR